MRTATSDSLPRHTVRACVRVCVCAPSASVYMYVCESEFLLVYVSVCLSNYFSLKNLLSYPPYPLTPSLHLRHNPRARDGSVLLI